MPARARKWIIAFLALDVLLAAAAVFFFFIQPGGILKSPQPAPTPAVLTVDAANPSAVQIGQPFPLVLRIHNAGSAPLEAVTLILPGELLAAADLSGLTPAAIEQIQYAGGMGYVLPGSLPPGETLRVEAVLLARAPLQYSGALGVSAGDLQAAAPVQISIDGPTPTAAVIEPTPLAALPLEPQMQAVVQIDVLTPQDNDLLPGWQVSGVLVSPDGLVLTSARAVLSSRDFPAAGWQVSVPSVGRVFQARLIRADAALDAAVLQINADARGYPLDRASLKLPAAVLTAVSAPSKGDALTAAGYVRSGEFTSIETSLARPAELQTALPGRLRGGAVFTAAGRLAGILTGPAEIATGGCLPVIDSNRDGLLTADDVCPPDGGELRNFRPLGDLLALIQAAQAGESGLQPAEPVEAEPVEARPGDLLVADDFSDPASGWQAQGANPGGSGYADGQYRLEAPDAWSLTTAAAGRNYQDVLVQVRATVSTHTGRGDYGLICRQRDPQNYYLFLLSEDGYASIWARVDGRLQSLTAWIASPLAFNYGGQSVQAACVGDALTLSVNGTPLVQTRDARLASGDVGLAAGTYAPGGIQVLFDDLQVFAPRAK